ncbi:uncharacterized protein CTRU02_212265 [Colletotrichum truncatum]|uniref:Uncharacterized protein n=1 Tax=Colletotrichum truncatum TaxID=5467 RepID=A0ACC3YQ41_COLTU|nr:uncharacterized protein CTRU02_08858 [Colletotrichum truncatum]KAF6789611.1 hypothetical protein CTRU02_08858 [Colletotrichum truncatum]
MNGGFVLRRESEASNFCTKVFIKGTHRPVCETCGADCCDTSTGWVIVCPKDLRKGSAASTWCMFTDLILCYNLES